MKKICKLMCPQEDKYQKADAKLPDSSTSKSLGFMRITCNHTLNCQFLLLLAGFCYLHPNDSEDVDVHVYSTVSFLEHHTFYCLAVTYLLKRILPWGAPPLG